MQVKGAPVDIRKIGKLLYGNILDLFFLHKRQQDLCQPRFCFPDPAVNLFHFHKTPPFPKTMPAGANLKRL